MSYNLKNIIKEFDGDDFGFSLLSDEEHNADLNKKDQNVQEYKNRLADVEKIILPFLTKLLKTADQEIIKWPNRGPVLEDQIQKILKLTRG
jgi:hypothetical protein